METKGTKQMWLIKEKVSCCVENGQLTLSFAGAWVGKDGPGSGHRDGFRIQFYWPIIKWRNYKRQTEPYPKPAHKELFVSMATRCRIVFADGYYGIGGEILGFGIGIDYQKQEK